MESKTVIFIFSLLLLNQGFATQHALEEITTKEFNPVKTSNKTISNVDEPLAFAVDVHGLILDDVLQPYDTFNHALDDFDNPTVIASNPEDNLRPFAITINANNNRIYAISREEERQLITIDAVTGISTVVAELTGLSANQSIWGMAIDENNTCFIVATDDNNHDTASFLYQCDLETGALTFIGSQTEAPDIHDIAATCDGELFGVDSASERLVKLDKITGSATNVGSLELDQDITVTGLFNLTYDRKNGVLYQYVLSSSGFGTALASLNQSSGKATRSHV